MNRRGFLKVAGAAPVGAAAAVVAPQMAAVGGQLIGAGSLGIPAGYGMNGIGPLQESWIPAIQYELRNIASLLCAARNIQYHKREWKDAYRSYRLSPWIKPADVRGRDCRLIWRKFGQDRKLLPSNPQAYSEEKELARMKKQWAKLPEWLRERAVELKKTRDMDEIAYGKSPMQAMSR